MTKRHYLLATVLFGGLLAGTASAAALQGSFTLSGVITVDGGANPAAMSWLSGSGAAERFNFLIGLPPVGDPTNTDLSQMNFTEQTIFNITLAGQPVGEDFAAFPFISFPGVNFAGTSDPLPVLLINHIDAGNGSPDCLVPEAGTNPPQTCTPQILQHGVMVPGPFTFTNNCVKPLNAACLPGEAGEVTKTDVGWKFTGITSDLLSTWSVSFTSTFNPDSFQDVLFKLQTTGSVQRSYAGNAIFDFAPINNPVPEPGTFALIGMGLIMATVAAKRLKKS